MYPKGVIEDVLVMVDKLIFPTDFYMLDMGSGKGTPMLLGRPFMKTANTTINVTSGKLTMEFDGDVIEYNIYDMNPVNDTSLCNINVINPKPLDALQSITEESIVDLPASIISSTNLQEVTPLLDEKGKSSPSLLGSRPSILTPQGKKPLSSIVQGAKIEHKHPPDKSKYGGRATTRMKKANGLRFKPFHEWFRMEVLNERLPKEPDAVG